MEEIDVIKKVILDALIRDNVPINWFKVIYGYHILNIFGGSNEILYNSFCYPEDYNKFNEFCSELSKLYDMDKYAYFKKIKHKTFSDLSEEKQAYIRLKYL